MRPRYVASGTGSDGEQIATRERRVGRTISIDPRKKGATGASARGAALSTGNGGGFGQSERSGQRFPEPSGSVKDSEVRGRRVNAENTRDTTSRWSLSMFRAASAPSNASRLPRHGTAKADRQAGRAPIRRYGVPPLRRHVTPASRRGAGTHRRADCSRRACSLDNPRNTVLGETAGRLHDLPERKHRMCSITVLTSTA